VISFCVGVSHSVGRIMILGAHELARSPAKDLTGTLKKMKTPVKAIRGFPARRAKNCAEGTDLKETGRTGALDPRAWARWKRRIHGGREETWKEA